MRIKLMGILTLFLCAAFSNAHAGYVYKPEMAVISGYIHDFKFDDELTTVRMVKTELSEQSSVVFAGSYLRSGWKLFVRDQEIKLNPYGGFKFEQSLNPGKNTFAFKAVGPDAISEEQVVELTGLALSPKLVTKVEPEKKWFFFPGVSFSSILVNQTGRSDYSSVAVTGKFSVNYRLVPRKWDLGGNVFGTVAQLTKSSDVNAHFFGANARVGYFFPPIAPDLFISLYGGYYFTTTFVTNDFFGYKNVGGPQIFPSVRKVLANGNVLSGHFKFSPIASSLSLLKLSNREIAVGLSYVFLLEKNRSLGVALDYSNLVLSANNVTAKTTTYNLGVQYGL